MRKLRRFESFTRHVRQKLRKKIFWKTEDIDTWWIAEAINWTACKLLGHNAVPDHCGMPKHDFCAWCMKSMPFQAKRA